MNKDLPSLYWWFFVVRVVGSFIISVGIGMLWKFGNLDFDPEPILLVLIPLYVVSNIIWWIVLKKNFFPRLFLYAQLTVDLVTITIGTYLSGGAHSQFAFLLIAPIVSSSVISIAATAGTAAEAFLFYAALIVGENLGLLTPISLSNFSAPSNLMAQFTVLFLIAAIIAFQSHFYFREARKKEAELTKIKDEFLLRTIHDLRSPSNSIQWTLDKLSLSLNPDLQKDFSMIQDLNKRMLDLLKDLGEVVKGEKSAMVLKQTSLDITEIIKTTAEELEPGTKSRKISYFYDPPENLPHIVADYQALKEIFTNLIDNATKYNKEGGSIKIYHKLNGTYLETFIEDTGKGIPKKDMPKLFSLYFRGDDDREIPGPGLGLYLIKKLTEKMNGTVSVVSKVGKGTIFSISLPLSWPFS